MINANELRIGNWVQRPTELEIPIIKEPKYWRITPHMIRDCDHYKEDWAFEPIPLTEEILLKCGFKIREITVLGATQKHYSNFRTLAIELLSDEYFMLGLHRGYDEIEPIRRVKYVHNLQNLVYALTNEELKIEL